MTSIILAGGKSSRLGRSKALQDIGGKSIIQWVIDRLITVSTEIIIVTGHGQAIPYFPPVGIRTVADIHPNNSPLVGIYSGLISSAGPRAIVVGCDMPFLSVSLLRYMAQTYSSFDVVVPRIQNEVEPLCAVYSKGCVAPIQWMLQQNELMIRKLFALVRVKYIEEDEVDRFDPEHLSFFNINSTADLSRAKDLAAKKGWLYSTNVPDSSPIPYSTAF